VRDVPGTKEERTRRSLYRLLADLERQLPFENPESLVLAMMYVERCLHTIWFKRLDERVAPARLLARGWNSPASTDTFTLGDVGFSYSILLVVGGLL